VLMLLLAICNVVKLQEYANVYYGNYTFPQNKGFEYNTYNLPLNITTFMFGNTQQPLSVYIVGTLTICGYNISVNSDVQLSVNNSESTFTPPVALSLSNFVDDVCITVTNSVSVYDCELPLLSMSNYSIEGSATVEIGANVGISTVYFQYNIYAQNTQIILGNVNVILPAQGVVAYYLYEDFPDTNITNLYIVGDTTAFAYASYGYNNCPNEKTKFVFNSSSYFLTIPNVITSTLVYLFLSQKKTNSTFMVTTNMPAPPTPTPAHTGFTKDWWFWFGVLGAPGLIIVIIGVGYVIYHYVSREREYEKIKDRAEIQ